MGSTTSSRGGVFLGPLEISGYYANLESGLRQLDVSARLVTLFPNTFGYGQGSPNPWPAAWAHRLVLRHRAASAGLRVVLGGLFVVASVLLLIWAIPRFRTFVFSWGMSLLPRNADLPLLRLLGKQVVVVVGHGSEARPPYMSTLPIGSSPADPATLDLVQRQTRRMIVHLRRIERWSDRVVGLPTTAQFLRRPFVDFYALGIPTEPAAVHAVAPRTDPGTVTVVHVPSKPEVKGTATIRACMEEIMARRPGVRYVEITGRPHDEVLQALASADLVIDQLWSDIPMAVVGTEAAALGTPTIIAGYAWEHWRRVLPPESWPPTICCDPSDLLAVVDSTLADLPAAAEIGRQAQTFVREQWACRAVAGRFLRVLDDDLEPGWLVDPADVDYPFGCGIDRADVLAVVHGLVARGGWDALGWSNARAVYEAVAA